jgi:hypothetical protein
VRFARAAGLPSTKMKRRLASEGALLAMVAVAATGVAVGSPSESSRADSCATSALTVHVVRWAVGTTHTGGFIAFTNHSSSPCRLSGWPALVGVAASGKASVARHVRSTWYGPYVKGIPTLTLLQGQTAQAAFAGSDLPPAGARTCWPSFRYLRVTPPGSARSVRLSAWFPPLGRFLPGCAPLEVSMVVPPAAFTR